MLLLGVNAILVGLIVLSWTGSGRLAVLGTRRPGDRVNVEADVLLKQIAAMLRSRRAGRVGRRKVG